MWFLGGFWRVLKGFWRLMVGLVIGAILYVWMFFSYKEIWGKVHHQTTSFMEWLVAQPMLVEYAQWNTLLNLDDKLTFALFIMAGRIIWLLIESVVITFPLWLVFGRREQKKTAESAPIAPVAEKNASVAPDTPPLPKQGIPPAQNFSSVEIIPPGAMAIGETSRDVSAKVEFGIEEELKKVRQVGKHNGST